MLVSLQENVFVGCAVAGGWKSKTQEGNFSTTYPTLLTPVKKIYFNDGILVKIREGKSESKNVKVKV